MCYEQNESSTAAAPGSCDGRSQVASQLLTSSQASAVWHPSPGTVALLTDAWESRAVDD